MSDPAVRQTITELYANQGWPAGGTELLERSLAPRGPELLLEAPGWLGLGPGQLVLDAGCRDGSYAVTLAERYGCRAGPPGAGAVRATAPGVTGAAWPRPA